MSDLIERDKAYDVVASYFDQIGYSRRYAKALINKVPSARPKGEWASALAELHERFDALENELRRASAEMSAIIREYVDRPKGEWILECDAEGEDDNLYRCSECGCNYGCQEYDIPNFCPNCGARMKGADDE